VEYLRSQQELIDAELLSLKRKVNAYEKTPDRPRGQARPSIGASSSAAARDTPQGLLASLRSRLRRLVR
jgi:hypothetical protein